MVFWLQKSLKFFIFLKKIIAIIILIKEVLFCCSIECSLSFLFWMDITFITQNFKHISKVQMRRIFLDQKLKACHAFIMMQAFKHNTRSRH